MRRVAMMAFAGLGLVGCAAASGPASEDAADPIPAEAGSIETGTPVPYSVEIQGVDDPDMAETMRAVSLLHKLSEKPPETQGALRWRAREDVDRLTQVLHSRGFYGAEVDYRITPGSAETRVALTVNEGIIYLLGDYDVAFDGSPRPAEETVPTLEDLGLHLGMVADAAELKAAGTRLVRHLQNHGWPFARIKTTQARLEPERTLVNMAVVVAPGRPAVFDGIEFEGLETVSADYLRRLVPWRSGKPVDRSKLSEYRARLRDTGLFASVGVEPAEPDSEGRAPVRVTVAEAPHRAIGAGVAYSTAEGPGGRVFWETNNLAGANENLRATLGASEIEQTLDVAARKPEFIVHGQDLVGGVTAKRVDSLAFNQIGLETRIGLERATPPLWRTGISLTGEFSRIDDEATGRQTLELAGLPVDLSRDSTDGLLDPTEGTRLSLEAVPYLGHGSEALLFGVVTANVSGYLPLDNDRRFVLAGRLRAGTVFGEDRADVPASKRFYAGGGGSVRGYEFQSIGPQDNAGNPSGGRALVELGGELRIRLGDFGIVPFVDAGQAYTNILPTAQKELQWSGGLGLRYFTAVGPLRFDVATPMNPRPDIDEDYQIYVSLGQAF